MMMLSALIAVLAVGLQNAASDTTPWQTVVSQEGQFVVDFPTQPTSTGTRTENGPGGKLKIITVACETPSVDYIARKLILPSPVLRGREDAELTDFRNYFVALFRGQLVTEKKVSFDGKPGRDITIRAQPQRGGPVGIIRIRYYLFGQSLYALIAVSAANRDLPEDVSRFYGSFAIGTKRLKKTGPKPEVAGKDLPGWGSVIDPDGDCKVTAEKKTLVIEIPATLHDLNADIDKYNAPRVLREVDGDFTMTVKVVGDFKPGTKSLNPKSVPYNGGGIFVWRDSDNYIRLERGAVTRNGKLGTFAIFEEREGGSRGAVHNGGLTPGTAYLRLARRTGRIFGFTSKDGKKWVALKPIDTKWPAQLKVGLNAINSGNAPFTVRFENVEFQGKTTDGSSSGQP